MRITLFLLSILLLIPACPEGAPMGGELEPLPIMERSAAPPPAPKPVAAAPAPKPAAAPASDENEPCCNFTDGGRVRGLTSKECGESGGTFDAGCKQAPKEASPAKAPEDGDSDGSDSCCTFVNGTEVKGIPPEACEAASGTFSADCGEDE